MYSRDLTQAQWQFIKKALDFNKGKKAEAGLGITNSQSVRWGNNRSLNGYDDAKKVKGIKDMWW